ncbi:MAG: sigma-70 family RNA polymerase sigma factor [Ruminococcus sp.]|jgi:RNA polymerase sigma factor for flagellar operon FliA|nr:sigma-70 family RNA polymerase sigma factor [Ruminococcus sp.]
MAKNDTDRAELIIKYKQTGIVSYRNDAVLRYMDVVKYYVFSLRNMYDGFIDPEEITNEAVVGLINAIDNFDIDRGVKFETYASVVVRGAIIDYIRKSGNIPHRLGSFYKQMQKVYQELYTKLDREPTNIEISEALGLPEDTVRKNLTRITSYRTTSLDEYLGEKRDVAESRSEEGVWQVEENAVRSDKLRLLTEAIKRLPERDRQIVTLYYYEKLTLAKIGEILDLTEARTCQILSAAIKKMKTYMGDFTN